MKWGFIGNNDLPGVEADARFAQEHGFNGLEYNYWGNFAELSEETVRHMKATLDNYGVGVAALGLWGWNHLSPDVSERETAHAMLDRAIEYAGILNAEILITGGGQIEGASIDEHAAQFAEVFPAFFDKTAAAGAQLCFYAVHGNSFFTSIEAYQRVWETIPEALIKFDPANWAHHGDDYLSILRDHGDKIGYVHIKEHLYMDGELASQPAAGMGDIEWGKVMAFLYEHGYGGYLSIEPHGPIWGQGPLREIMLILSQRYIGQFML